ncbi:uncharacterized protein LOC123878873 [Maniola jurtina]|uniref:uncharacterized protein LOC123867730 n=1 Tax=Maniola jurtina TaxID=191418 RepID=UPI001E686DA0|nr:uncharacterized protein LOC123867730 [Maniola jurtina]XP_045771010.1 uncharacterized protein LOC123871317 [Maniola jurtina]XP_045776478.1 uncharacterized protein LOC123874941 [Maniola jurtina]XP_045779951.1 uncharacterized protein LOC123877336 [Maniola jurtina]XP_045781846.1 uncharacterized protein LOC123878598 [Maniola jurtina]XP_045782071.1 uncharacterized protein LOC123878793 [Maniola jurtina]XP_045782198.1 uncharacterized protein LOC123878873 [Maniola jurtina]
MEGERRVVCITCTRSVLRDRNRHHLTRDYLEDNPGFTEYVMERININEMALNQVQYMCHRCWVAGRRQQARFEQEQNQELGNPEQPTMQPTSVPTYRRVANTARHCLFRGCINQELHRVSSFIKVLLLVDYSVYVPENARICAHHINSNDWSSLYENGETIFTPDQLKDMIDTLRAAYKHKTNIDFDNVNNISPEDLFYLTGLTHQQFSTILSETPSLLAQCKRPKTALGVYLLKLRSGEPNTRIASQIGVSRKTIGVLLKTARNCLTQDFVVRHLGFNHISRNDIIAHSLAVPSYLYSNPLNPVAIVLCDGSYIYVQKSKNFLFQKKTYSLHKYKNLLKPFLITCPDGYIIDICGPYAATKTDAQIMSDIMNDTTSPVHIVLQTDDVFILDRGFRDSIPEIESAGYVAHMPPSKDRHATQLTDIQANKSRQITIVRWVIEVINGWFKRDYKIFRHTLINKTLPHVFTDFRIAGALINAFRQPLTDNEHAQAFIGIIAQRINEHNILGNYVVTENINRQRAVFTTMTATLIPFPQLTEEDVILFSLGTYHLKLARSYVAEHLRGGDGLYNIEVSSSPSPSMAEHGLVTENCSLIRGRILSRHVSNKIYYTYILLKENIQGREAIAAYYCSCMTGMRTLGACAHTVSIIWYLGVGRHLDNFVGPANAWDDVIIESSNTI